MCKYIGDHLKNLKIITFWLRLTRKQLDSAIFHPDGPPAWTEACRKLNAESVDIKLMIEQRVLKVYTVLKVRHWYLFPPPTSRGGNWIEGKYSSGTQYAMKVMEPLLKKQIVGDGSWTLTDDIEEDLGLLTLFEGLDSISTYLGMRKAIVEAEQNLKLGDAHSSEDEGKADDENSGESDEGSRQSNGTGDETDDEGSSGSDEGDSAAESEESMRDEYEIDEDDWS